MQPSYIQLDIVYTVMSNDSTLTAITSPTLQIITLAAMVQQRRALFLPLLVGCILSSRTTSGFNLLDVAVPTVTSSGLPNGADIAFGFTLAQHMLPDGQKV